MKRVKMTTPNGKAEIEVFEHQVPDLEKKGFKKAASKKPEPTSASDKPGGK